MNSDQKYLFVGEYNHAYTGGSVVIVGTEDSLKELEFNGLKFILDDYNIQLRKVRGIGGPNGIFPEHFWKIVDHEDFTDEFKNILRGWLEENKPDWNNNRYPGYGDGRIRTDWFPSDADGIYIVYKLPVDSDMDDGVISDTYYMA